MRIRPTYLAITSSAILMLAGCVQSSDSAANTNLSDSLKASAVVSEIRILSVPANTSPEFRDKLASSLKRALATCTSGTHKLRLDATVYSYKAPNPAMAMLIVTTEGLTGKAQLVEPDTNAVVADISIANTTAGGGLIGIAAMANGEEKMTEEFAYDVCKKGFGRKPQLP